MKQKEEKREKKYLEEGGLNNIVFLPLEEVVQAAAPLSTEPEFRPFGNGREYGLNYDKHIPLEEFDIKRAKACGMIDGLDSLGGCHFNKDTIEIRIVSERYPEKTWLYYVLTPLRWAAYAADIPCSIILSTGAYAGGAIHCVFGSKTTSRP